ncbi:MAG: hypothetical protein ACJ74Z_15295 [Bryobacteraceae bacterium]
MEIRVVRVVSEILAYGVLESAVLYAEGRYFFIGDNVLDASVALTLECASSAPATMLIGMPAIVVSPPAL